MTWNGAGRSRDVTRTAKITCANDHAGASAGKVRGVSLGSSLIRAEYQGRTAHSLFHVFEHPIKPLSNQWDTEHADGCYLGVSPSSIAMVEGATRDDFEVTLHRANGPPQTVTPTRVIACQPDRVTFSKGTATALRPGPAALGFVYELPDGPRTELRAVCYVWVVTDQ